jgi:hypothetical protein
MRIVFRKLFKGGGIVAIAWTILRTLWDFFGHASTAQWLWDIVKDWPIYLKYAAVVVGSTWFPLVLSVLCLVSWWLLNRKERGKPAPTQSSDKPAGGLIGRIPHVAFFDGPNERDGVVVALQITNRGDPTIVDRWGLIIELDGRKFQYRATHFQKDFTIWDNKRHPVKLESSQMLYERVENTPIPKGGRQIGYLIFLTKDISFEQLKATRPRLRVIFSDAFGNEYVAESSSESTGTILYQPGLNDPLGQILLREAVLAKSVRIPLTGLRLRKECDKWIESGKTLRERLVEGGWQDEVISSARKWLDDFERFAELNFFNPISDYDRLVYFRKFLTPEASELAERSRQYQRAVGHCYGHLSILRNKIV